MHGEMTYLERYPELRFDPEKLLPGAQTMIVLLAAYESDKPVYKEGDPRISRYALGEDYHKVLKKKSKQLIRWIRRETGTLQARFFTDSAPLLEREWARRAGLGWIGRNGCLIVPGKGSWFFIAEILTDLKIAQDEPFDRNFCGSCTRCLNACPTGALLGDGRLDARKCISYLTIEHRSEIPDEYQGVWSDWIFGCDICQEVCPWNKDPEKVSIAELLPDNRRISLSWNDLQRMTPELFDELFGSSPVKRAGYRGFMRNISFLHPNRADS